MESLTGNYDNILIMKSNLFGLKSKVFWSVYSQSTSGCYYLWFISFKFFQQSQNTVFVFIS